MKGHSIHKLRFIDRFLGVILRSKFWYNNEPYCSCIYSFENDNGCRQIDFMNGDYKVAGTYGEDVFICKYCYENDREEIDKWSKARKDFVNKVKIEDPELWAISTRNI